MLAKAPLIPLLSVTEPFLAPVVSNLLQQAIQFTSIASHTVHQRTGELNQVIRAQSPSQEGFDHGRVSARIEILLVEYLQGNSSGSTSSDHDWIAAVSLGRAGDSSRSAARKSSQKDTPISPNERAISVRQAIDLAADAGHRSLVESFSQLLGILAIRPFKGH